MHSDVENKRIERRELVREFATVGVVAALVLGVGLFVQRPEVRDFFRGFGYEEEAHNLEIEEALELTAEGKRIFRATQPVVETSAAFNEHCTNQKEDVALLGCYTGGRMYIYEITKPELKDANKVTAAHELLHAAWERMSKREREKLSETLQEVYAENQDWFETELGTYSDEYRTEEMYTRAGTKLADLPEELEKHFARYFRNRAQIVKYYESYQAPFRELKAKNEELKTKILTIKTEIEQEREDYIAAAEQLNHDIEEFGQCAEQLGCFASDDAFQKRKTGLKIREEGLNSQRERLNKKIEENNTRVAEYQENQAALGELSDAMNSQVIKEKL